MRTDFIMMYFMKVDLWRVFMPVKVFAITHKSFVVPSDPCIYSLRVGGALARDLGYVGIIPEITFLKKINHTVNLRVCTGSGKISGPQIM